jgi:hypothetical protein
MSSLYLMLKRNVHNDPKMKFLGWISTDSTVGGAVILGQVRSALVTGHVDPVFVTARGTFCPKMLEVVIYENGCEHRAVINDKDVGPDAIRLKFVATPMNEIDCRLNPKG